jgi:hypothetical protein
VAVFDGRFGEQKSLAEEPIVPRRFDLPVRDLVVFEFSPPAELRQRPANCGHRDVNAVIVLGGHGDLPVNRVWILVEFTFRWVELSQCNAHSLISTSCCALARLLWSVAKSCTLQLLIAERKTPVVRAAVAQKSLALGF